MHWREDSRSAFSHWISYPDRDGSSIAETQMKQCVGCVGCGKLPQLQPQLGRYDPVTYSISLKVTRCTSAAGQSVNPTRKHQLQVNNTPLGGRCPWGQSPLSLLVQSMHCPSEGRREDVSSTWGKAANKARFLTPPWCTARTGVLPQALVLGLATACCADGDGPSQAASLW